MNELLPQPAVSAAAEISPALMPRLAGLLEMLPSAIALIDRRWHLVYANREAIRLSRLPEERVFQETLWELFPGLAASSTGERYRRAMETGVGEQFEQRLERTGQWFAVELQASTDGIAVIYRDISAKRQIQEQEAATARRAQQVYEAAPECIVLVDRQYRFTFANQRAFDLLGVPSLLGHNIFELFPGNRQEPYCSAYTTAMEERRSMEFEAFHGAPLHRWFKVQAQPYEDGIIIFFSDVTARRSAQEDLVASEARYRVLADLNPQAIWMGDPQGNITYANQRLRRYLGMTRSQVLARAWLEAVSPAEQKAAEAAWRASVAGGLDLDLTVQLRQAETGDYRWWHVRAAPVRDPDGAIRHWLGVGQEIHEQREAAEQLRLKQIELERQHAELETLYRTSPVGLALLDPVDFVFLNMNDREAEILGRPKAELLGKRLEEVAPIPELLELFRSVAAGNTVRSRLLEGELAARPGERRAWSVNYSPLFDEQGKVRAISTASIEITDQKRAEAALVQSEKLAAVGRLASSISHEINNPLEAITNLLYIIASDDQLAEGLKTYVAMAQSELSRVSQIVTQTLRFHRQAVAPTLVTARELVNAVIQLYTGRLSNSNIVVDARYYSNTRVRCFENDVRQVLNNLIANAIDAMRTGGRLLIRAHDAVDQMQDGVTLPGTPAWQFPSENRGWTAAGRKGVRITIADTGCGMTPQTMARAFEPFFTTKDLNGTGLGLWISAGIVERHQGRLRVRSNADPEKHYSVFSLFLPCEEIAAG
jgi:PAS domain S-box-containing protein